MVGNLKHDELAASLLPDDVHLSCDGQQMYPAQTCGNGDCLYNAVLLSLRGCADLTYPMCNEGVRPLFHSLIDAGTKLKPLYVMWTRDSNLDRRPGTVFQPLTILFVLFQATVDLMSKMMKFYPCPT